jgi:hypothetical protein
VQADDQRTVLLDERSVKPEHVNDQHSALQLVERLQWAIRDESSSLEPASSYRPGIAPTFD